MKNNLRVTGIIIAMLTTLITGCGSTNEVGNSQTVESTVATTAEQVVETESTEAPHEHVWMEATYKAPKTCSECGETEGEKLFTFFEENNLKLEEEDSFILNTKSWDTDKSVELPISYVISEEAGAAEGYKKITSVVAINTEGTMNNGGYRMGAGAFDAYTGTILSISDETKEGSVSGENGQKITIDGVDYDINFSLDFVAGDPEAILTMSVNIPQDYDGTVFYISYMDAALSEKNTSEEDGEDKMSNQSSWGMEHHYFQ